MCRNLLVALTVLALAVFVPNNTTRAQGRSSTPPDSSFADSLQQSLVTVTAYDGAGKVITSGGGCFVRDNVIVTDYLTIKDAASIKISTSRAPSITGWLFAVDQSRLLALIHPDGIKAPPLLPAESSNLAASNTAGSKIAQVQPGLAVVAAGGGTADLRPVTISVSTGKPGDPRFRIDAHGQRLLGGSPIINGSGNIAGIVTATENAGPEYSYAVPAQTLSKLIDQTVNDVAGGTWVELQSDKQAPTASNGEFARTDDKGVKAGKVIRRVDPAYPALAKAAGIGGPAVVEIAIDEAGYVTGARPVQGDPRLLDAAAAAAMGWRYAPSTRSGAPVKFVTTLTFNFDPGKEQSGQESTEIAKHIREVEANPRSEAAVLGLGKAYYVLGRYDDALKQFQAAVALAPDDPVAFYQVGSAYMSLRYYNDAIEAIGQAVALRPDYLEALGLLAFAYNSSERYEEAIPFCRQALSFQSRNADAYHGLGWAYGGLHRFQDAIVAYKIEVGIRPYYAGAHYGLGVMYTSIGDYAGATHELKQAIEINPFLAIAHSHLGLVYVATRDKASAERELATLRPLDGPLAWQLEEAIRKAFHPDSK